MPRAEAGTTKALANQMKSKGLQRLRWYCQPCEKQCRDENGFKCHTQSESHVRQMQAIGANPNRAIADYSAQFVADFVRQLRTQHNTKATHINQFYQTYIANKEHVHMNATKWKSLTEFAKHLGREGICRVEETDKGLHIAWIDNSPEALARQEAIRKRERMDKGDEEIELKMIREQVERAHARAKEREREEATRREQDGATSATESTTFAGKVSLNLSAAKPLTPPGSDSVAGVKRKADELTPPAEESETASAEKENTSADAPRKTVSLGLSAAQPFNPFPIAKSALKKERLVKKEPAKKMSAAERIMREEMEAKKRREERGSAGGTKRVRV